MTSVTVTCAGIVGEFGEKLRLRAITVRVTGSSDAGVDVGSVGAGWRIKVGVLSSSERGSWASRTTFSRLYFLTAYACSKTQ